VKRAAEFGIVLLIALGFTVLPQGDAALSVLLTLLLVAFFVLIALFGYRLYREHRWSIESLPEGHRLLLYGAVALAFLTFTATPRLFAVEGYGWVIWLALLSIASYGVYWVLSRARRAY
jgi:hypothetical protein